MRPAALTALFALGCVPALPPPAHYAPDAPVAADTAPAAEVGVYGGVLPTVGGGYTYPLPQQPAFALEGRGQVGISHAAISPGIWWRSHPEEHAGHHVGVRLGLAAGSGDVIAFVPYRMPYGGGGLAIQYAYGLPRSPLGAVSATLSADGLVPLHYLLQQTIPTTDANGEEILAAPLPSVYGGLNLRWDLPATERLAIWLGASIDVSMWGYFLPGASMGARWTPAGRSGADHHSPP